MGCGSQETAGAEQGAEESNSQSWMGGPAGEKPGGQQEKWNFRYPGEDEQMQFALGKAGKALAYRGPLGRGR